MKFRPCIDIHNGKVKQIVGGSLLDAGNQAKDNFVSELDAGWYARTYREYELTGGHIIILNAKDSEYYEEDLAQAKRALKAFPGGLQIGGGITTENAKEFIEAGATHVIVTSYVFRDGIVDYDRLNALVDAVGKEHIVLDLSCRKKDEDYYVVTNRWQTFTDEKLDHELLTRLADYCDEFLIHAVDVEGKAQGVELPLVKLLADWKGLPMTYAGGVGTFEDLQELKQTGHGLLDVTIGSALDLFGGTMEFQKVIAFCNEII